MNNKDNESKPNLLQKIIGNILAGIIIDLFIFPNVMGVFKIIFYIFSGGKQHS
ncbi:MAG: hypothetical protein V4548_11515 [Bacteroidota bacterium]